MVQIMEKRALLWEAQPTVKRRMHDGARMQENKTLDSAFLGPDS